jgi:hypothetical protein
MSNPRDFFENSVKPSYQTWLSDPLTEWKAKTAISNADIMAERIWKYWIEKDQTRLAGAKTASRYRIYLRENVCPDFGLVWDLHDGHKHVTLDRANRQVTSAAQTGVARMGYGQGGYGQGIYGGSDQIVIDLDDGSKRFLSEVMQNVMEMWSKLLADMGL